MNVLGFVNIDLIVKLFNETEFEEINGPILDKERGY